MWNPIKRLFCKHKNYIIVGYYFETMENGHVQKKWIRKCKHCKKEW